MPHPCPSPTVCVCCRFSLKFFMLQQMAFWLHCYPEIYLMKQTRGDGIYRKLVLYTSSLLIILGAYIIQ